MIRRCHPKMGFCKSGSPLIMAMNLQYAGCAGGWGARGPLLGWRRCCQGRRRCNPRPSSNRWTPTPAGGLLSDLLDMDDEEEEDEEDFYTSHDFTVQDVVQAMDRAIHATVGKQNLAAIEPFFTDKEKAALQKLLSAA